MDKIILKNMAFFGYHGASEEENKLGQRFYIDAELFLDLRKAGGSDDLNSTVHYGMAYEKIKEIVEGTRFDLIEALAHNVCLKLLEEHENLEKVQLTVRKPSAPVSGIFDYMAVEVTRTREDLG